MSNQNDVSSNYNGSLTREQFLFYETRTVAKLMCEGLSDDEIINRIFDENLLQNPTEKMVKNLTGVCLLRLHTLDDASLVDAVANAPSDVAKQVCLYSMMKYNRLMREFMINVIGEKYRQQDLSFSKKDLNVFFMQLQEQDDGVASWTDKTIAKIKQVLVRVLVENEYLDDIKSTTLNPVLISSVLEAAIRNSNDNAALPAFNCFM